MVKYAPLEIPLQELAPAPGSPQRSAGSDPGPDSDSDVSDTSDVLAEICEYAKTAAEPDTFETDARFVGALGRFRRRAVSSRNALVGCVLGAALWAALLFFYASANSRQRAAQAWSGPRTSVVGLASRNVTLNAYAPGRQNVTLANYRRGVYWPQLAEVEWLEQAQFPSTHTAASRGFYLCARYSSRAASTQFVVAQANTDYEQVVLPSVQLSHEGQYYYADDLVLNPAASVDDRRAVHLLRSDSLPQWRHSALSHYWVWTRHGTLAPVSPTGAPERLHFARFSPDGRTVVFGCGHNVYLMDVASGRTTQVTRSGSHSVYNGVPDWVYEEEVYPQDHMVWWSPDSRRLVYAVINDTQVADYTLDYYVKAAAGDGDGDGDGHQYPQHRAIKYPKPGTANPVVQLVDYDVASQTQHVLDLHDAAVGHDFVLYDAAWLDADSLLVKVADRTSTVEQKKLYTAGNQTVRLVSTVNATAYGGWVEKTSPVVVVKAPADGPKYLDRVVEDGVVQLALFDSPGAAHYARLLGPVAAASPVAYDSVENCVYGVFGTNLNTSFARVSLDDGATAVLARDGVFQPRFSPGGQYVELKCLGPGVPWQKMFAVAPLAEKAVALADLPALAGYDLRSVLADTNLPTRVRSAVTVGHGSGAVTINVLEIFPPNFDPRKKHPLLVHAYGGPGSTTVTDNYAVDFQDIVSAQLDAVVLIIDPRGTGSDDWRHRAYATGRLGYWEPRDITAVAKDYVAKNAYIDGESTAIWGWSYGGFTALKTLEYDAGNVFKYGMAVAPVTNWMFYDSVYTERYMKSPAANDNYQRVSRINDIDRFKHVTRFLVMHGTADDNVHLQNTMWLLDRFDTSGVENYDVHFFPDSDHSIYYHNANAIVYDKLFWWLQRAFSGRWKG